MVQVVDDLSIFPTELQRCAVSIGNFDGVHRGHAILARKLVELARAHQGPAIVITFDPHPAEILRPDIRIGPPLSSIERRAQLLGKLGVSAVVRLATDPKLLSLSPQEFFQKTLVDKLHAVAMAEGPNFRFGRDRSGDITQLEVLCQQAGMDLQIIPPESDPSGMISSTRIRELLNQGEVGAANQLLIEPYATTGRVIRGAGRGAGLGFPTANLVDLQTYLPGDGVYAAAVKIGDESYAAAINIGPNPTFGEHGKKVEAHVVGFAGDLYDTRLTCVFLEKIRGVFRFDSVDALREQIAKDVLVSRRVFDSAKPSPPLAQPKQ